LAPPGCKAIIYENGNTQGLWALRGVNAWYLGPNKDHYGCGYYYIIKTRAYQISGSTELLPQHCQLPNLSPHQHLRALTDELADATKLAGNTPKGKRLLKYLIQKTDNLLHPTPPNKEQRLANKTQLARRKKNKG
jgi:hypothetical protein